MQRLSQTDPRWKTTKFGVPTSTLTIGDYGCTITSIANLTDNLTPLDLASKCDYSPQANLVWNSLKSVGIDFHWRQYDGNYDTIRQKVGQGYSALIQIIKSGYTHWLAVISIEGDKVRAIDPLIPGQDSLIAKDKITGSAFFKIQNNQNMSKEYNQLLSEAKLKLNLVNPNNGQDWSGRLQGLINSNDFVTFNREFTDVISWNCGDGQNCENLKEELEKKQDSLEKIKKAYIDIKGELEAVKSANRPKLTLEQRNKFDFVRQFVPVLTAIVPVAIAIYTQLPTETQEKLITELNAGNFGIVAGIILSAVLSYYTIDEKNKRKIEEEKKGE